MGQRDVSSPHDRSSAMPLVSFCWTTHAHCLLMVVIIYCAACVEQTPWLHDSSLVALPSTPSSQCQGAKQDRPSISSLAIAPHILQLRISGSAGWTLVSAVLTLLYSPQLNNIAEKTIVVLYSSVNRPSTSFSFVC